MYVLLQSLCNTAFVQQPQFPFTVLIVMSFFSQVFGFIATIVFALDFYLIFNELANFLKQGGESNDEPSRQQGNTPNYNLIYGYIRNNPMDI